MTGWYRSWPEPEPNYGPRVIDHLPRLYMHNHDYNTVKRDRAMSIEGSWPHENLCLLEWDMALDSHNRDRFVAAIHRYDTESVWCLGYWLNGDRWLAHGFGCIYLPWSVVKAWKATGPELWTDVTFFAWYGHENVHTCHDIQPQHLNS